MKFYRDFLFWKNAELQNQSIFPKQKTQDAQKRIGIVFARVVSW